jgi:hypothetical protein
MKVRRKEKEVWQSPGLLFERAGKVRKKEKESEETTAAHLKNGASVCATAASMRAARVPAEAPLITSPLAKFR